MWHSDLEILEKHLLRTFHIDWKYLEHSSIIKDDVEWLYISYKHTNKHAKLRKEFLGKRRGVFARVRTEGYVGESIKAILRDTTTIHSECIAVQLIDDETGDVYYYRRRS